MKNKRIRLISKKRLKKAYDKKLAKNQLDIKEELAMENIEKVPKELFQLLGETLYFIEKANRMEGEEDEDK